MVAKRLLILGVTASGKGRLAFDLARQYNAEIISVDSMKVYQGMDIGTAKPSQHDRQTVPYHLIDVVQPSESFSVGAFVEQANNAIRYIESQKKTVIGVGGTALYIKALLYGLFQGPGAHEGIRDNLLQRMAKEGSASLYSELARIDPEAADRIDPHDTRRIVRALEVYQLTGRSISSFQNQFTDHTGLKPWTAIGLRRAKAEENKRINARVKRMIEAGLIDEVKALLARKEPLSKQAAVAIGYAEIIDYLAGKYNLDEAVERIKINTRRLAKGQRTWFKTFTFIHWIDISEDQTPEDIMKQAIALWNP
jgi:tRNA dimethylallyltransferase